ncbi:MAG: PP2C family protein-serine/threonine phosphatase [Pirellula sp.]|jgi:serine/threonine protein phosphatase PrpC
MLNADFPWKIKLAGVSDRGLAQKQNEDRCFVGGMEEKLSFAMSNCGFDGEQRWRSLDTRTQTTAVMAIADGFSELPSGDKAAEMAIRTAMEYMSSSVSFLNVSEAIKGHFAKAIVRRAFDLCDQEIYEHQRRIARDRGMRTTLSIVVVTGDEMTIAHTGDCRVSLVRDGQIRQLTHDYPSHYDNSHTSSTAQVIAVPQTSNNDQLSNSIWNCLGGRDAVNPDISQIPVTAGDCVLVSSSGLCRHVGQDEILSVANRFHKPDEICDKLLSLALERGGLDNTTILCCCIRNPIETEAIDRKAQASATSIDSADYVFRSSLGFGICF